MLFGRDREKVRPPAVAGSFYPRNPQMLQETIAGLLSAAKGAHNGSVRAVIAPHAGYMYSGAVAAEAFAGLGVLKDRVKRLVVIGPSHFVSFRGIAAPGVDAFCTPLGEMPVDHEAIARIDSLPQVVVEDKPHSGEHALEVELPFLQTLFGAVPVVPLVVGSASADDVAQVLEALWDEETLIIVSSDLSHYHDYETTRRLDAKTADAIERLDDHAIGYDAACGSLAVRGLLISARRRGFVIDRLDLRNSGDTAGDRDRVVGYGAWSVRQV